MKGLLSLALSFSLLFSALCIPLRAQSDLPSEIWPNEQVSWGPYVSAFNDNTAYLAMQSFAAGAGERILLARAQGTDGYAWTREISLENSNPTILRGSRTLGNGDALLWGTYGTPVSPRDFVFLLRITAAGELSWAIAGRPGTSEQRPEGVLEDSQGNLLFYGRYLDGGSEFGIFLNKISPDGNPVWAQKFFNVGSLVRSGGLAETNDGKLLQLITFGNKEEHYLLQINPADGKLEAAKSFTTAPLQAEPLAIFVDAENDMTLFFKEVEEEFGPDRILMSMAGTAALDQLPALTRNLYQVEDNDDTEVEFLAADTDGGFIGVGAYEPENDDLEAPFVLKLRADLQPLWTLGYQRIEKEEFLTAVSPIPGGGYWATGGQLDPGGDLYPPIVLALGSKGEAGDNFCELDTLNTERNIQSQPVSDFSLENIALPGVELFSASAGFNTREVSSDRTALACTTTAVQNLRELGIALYPNPVRSHLTLTLPAPGLADELRVFNLQGQMVQRRQLRDRSLELDMSDWPRQTYILTLWKQNHLLGSERLILE